MDRGDRDVVVPGSRAEATAKGLEDARLLTAFARWSKFTQRGRPRKAERDAVLRAIRGELPDAVYGEIALVAWQRHPELFPRRKYQASRKDPDDMTEEALCRLTETVRKALRPRK